MADVSVSHSPFAGRVWGPVGPPPWAVGLVGATRSIHESANGVVVQRATDDSFCLASVRIAGAASLSASDLQDATTDAYQRLRAAVEEGAARHLVRVWNFIPGILEPLNEMPQRYMAFNAGRFAAYSAWYAGEQAFESRVATASGVGHDGRDLVVYALAARRRGEPVDNPRQVPSYRYSSRYGPRPPCFSRATRVTIATGQPPWLLVGGTASVCGEETRHEGELEAQLDETLLNLGALVGSGLSGPEGVTDVQGALGCFRHLRVYYVRPGDEAWLRRSVEERFPSLERLEVFRADLCRPGLLVEIEGVAVPYTPPSTRRISRMLTRAHAPQGRTSDESGAVSGAAWRTDRSLLSKSRSVVKMGRSRRTPAVM